MVEYMYASIGLFTNILVKKIWQRLCLPRDFVDNICMVKTDVEGHDLVILRFNFFFSKKIMKMYPVLHFYHWYRDLEPWFRPKVLWVEWWRCFILEVDQYKGDFHISNIARGKTSPGYCLFDTWSLLLNKAGIGLLDTKF